MLCAIASVNAQAQSRAAQSRAELDALKSRLKEVEAAAGDTEKTRADADRALKQAEQAVSRIVRKLRELRREQDRVTRELASVREQQALTEQRVEAGRAALAHWLRRYYQHGGEPGVGQMLSAREPNQLARDAYYLERVGREKQAIVNDLREAEAQFRDQAAQIESRQGELKALASKQRAQADELKQERDRRARLLADVSAALAAQRAEIGALKQDETRLIALIRKLETAPPPPVVRPRPPRGETAEPSDPGQQTGRAADGSLRGKPFAQLRGALRVPVQGRLTGRFGADRDAGGASWKGIFIRSGAGAEVHAVADGVVVFSDWLRGFGNLVIVDHGDNYLTVYGNNEALFKSTGERVDSGEVIAAVGDSGGNPETGLYFEIRHRGQPVDPLQWIRRD
jgi:septal ring factor EnvC (AmiA/AmiB activator)